MNQLYASTQPQWLVYLAMDFKVLRQHPIRCAVLARLQVPVRIIPKPARRKQLIHRIAQCLQHVLLITMMVNLRSKKEFTL
jgi:hypothetical protein